MNFNNTETMPKLFLALAEMIKIILINAKNVCVSHPLSASNSVFYLNYANTNLSFANYCEENLYL